MLWPGLKLLMLFVLRGNRHLPLFQAYSSCEEKVDAVRWLPRVITNILPLEREFEKETWSISVKSFPVKINHYGYC